MKKTPLLLKQIELLRISLNQFETDADFYSISSNSSAYVDYFYKEGDLLKDEFVQYIKPSLMAKTRNTLDFLRSVSSKSGDIYNSSLRGISFHKDYIVRNINQILSCLEEEKKVFVTKTIFYSWQTDSPNSTNRSFIESCLEKAIKKINAEFGLSYELDKDTKNVPGSPNISLEILRKIEKCAIFVSDVTIVAKSNKIKRYIVNQNVLFETGFAFKVLSSEKIILVQNKAFYPKGHLPFDLGYNRVTSYICKEKEDSVLKKAEKEKLINSFYNAIYAIEKAE